MLTVQNVKIRKVETAKLEFSTALLFRRLAGLKSSNLLIGETSGKTRILEVKMVCK
jgi:hypothetical protein